MKKLLMIIVCFVSALLSPFAVWTAHAERNEQDERMKQIDDYIKKEMKATHIPGLALGIVKGDQILHLKGYGKEISPQTPFILGSTSKAFTAMAIMQLVEEGKIDLDLPIQTYLPSIGSPKITVRQLLNQNSGISISDNFKIKEENIGRVFQYSNQNYKLLGKIITSVSKAPYEEYIRKNIFLPLSMKHSYTSQAAAKEGGLARGYRSWFGFNIPNELPFNEEFLPAGYLISSAEDMTHFLIAQMNNGQYNGHTLVSDTSIKEMHTPSVRTPIFGEDSYYGMGWFISKNNEIPTIWHGGELPNYYSFMMIMPNENYGIILLANSNNSILMGQIGKIGEGIKDILAGNPPASIPSLAYVQTYLILYGVILIVLVLLGFQIKNLASWHTKLMEKELGIFKKAFLPLCIHFIFPVLMLTQIPNLTDFTWSFLYAFIPDLSTVVWVIAIVLITVGCIKLYLWAVFCKKKAKCSSIRIRLNRGP